MELNVELVNKIIEKYRGVENNPLNGKTFAEIELVAKKELELK